MAPDPEPKPDGRANNGRTEGTLANLRRHAIKPGEVRNKTGTNRYAKAQARFLKFAMHVEENGKTRDENVLMATYLSALKPGPAGAADRKLWREHLNGKARQQVDLSNEDGSMIPSVLRVLSVPTAEPPTPPDEPKGDVG